MLYFETREDYESNKPPLKDSRVALAEYSIYRAGEADLVVQPADVSTGEAAAAACRSLGACVCVCACAGAQETHGRKFCLRCPTRREADVWIQWFAEHGCVRGTARAGHEMCPS